MSLYKAILICSVFSTPYIIPHGYAMEDQKDEDFNHAYLAGQSVTLQNVAPSRGMTREVAERFSEDIREKAKKDWALAYEIGKKVALKRDLGAVVTELMEVCLTDANQKLIGQFFQPRVGREGEFNEEALGALIKLVYDKFTYTLRYFTHKEKLYAYDGKGNRFPVYRDEHIFDALVDACLPDALGNAKGMMLTFVRLRPVHDYLMNKFNHMLVKSISSLYHGVTGKTLKQSLAELVNRVIAGQGYGEKDEKNPKVEEKIPEREAQETGSYVWRYLKPQLIHCMRLAFSDVIKPNLERAIKDLGYYSLLKIVPRSNVLSSYLTSATLGTVAVSAAGGTPLGLLVGGPLGLAGWYVGSTAKDSFLSVVRNRVVTYLDLFVQFKIDQFLPYSYEEHCLYYLNDNPTKLEKSFYRAEYQSQKRLNQQTLIGSLLKDAVQYSWLARIFKVSHLDESRSDQRRVKSRKNDLAMTLALGAIITKRKKGESLSPGEEELFNNLQTYPTYGVKASEIELVKMWGEKDKKISEKARLLQKERDKAEGKLLEIYDLYMRQIPREIAWAYQQLGNGGEYADHDLFSLDYIEVEEIIAESLKKHIGQFSNNDLEMLQKAIKDGEFLMQQMGEDIVNTWEKYSQECSYPNQILVERETRDCNMEERHEIGVQQNQGKFKKHPSQLAQEMLKDPNFLISLSDSCLEKLLATYIWQNRAQLDEMRNSLLGVGLSWADIIKLHQEMNPDQFAKYISKEKFLPYEEALPQALESLMARNGDKDRAPETQAIKAELQLIGKKVNSILQGYHERLIHHYTAQFMDWVKENTDYNQIFETIIRQSAPGTEEDYNKDQNLENEHEKIDQVAQKYLVVFDKMFGRDGDWSVFNAFNKQLKNSVKVAQVRKTIREQIYNFVYLDFLDFLNHSLQSQNQKEIVVPQKREEVCESQSTEEMGDFGWCFINQDLDQEPMIDETTKKGKEKENNLSRFRGDKERSYDSSSTRTSMEVAEQDSGAISEEEPRKEDMMEMEAVVREKIKEDTSFVIEPFEAELSTSDPSDVAGAYLSEIVNRLIKQGRIEDCAALPYEDVIRNGTLAKIYQEVQRVRMHETMEKKTFSFVKDNLPALIHYKNTLPEYYGRLFYGYMEIIERLMERNSTIIKEILNSK